MSDALDEALTEIKAGKARPLYLVAGEEFLARRAAEALCDALVPPEKRDFNFAQVDGAAGGREIALQLDTVPMFRGTKVVFVESADVLLAKRDIAKELARARELWNQPARKKDAARRLLGIIAPAGWTWRELDSEAPDAPPRTRWKKEIGFEPNAEDRAFFSEVARFCQEQDLKAPRDDGEVLQRSVTAGPPKGNHLILLCEEYDTKHPVAQAVKERGLILSRGVDRIPKARGIESLDISALAAEILVPLGKRLTPGAARLLKDRVGEAMRQMASEMEKLAVYVGSREAIDERDVELLVAPLREEEFFELGTAIGDGDIAKGLKLVQDDLARGKHPLLLMGGITGSIRRLAMDGARFAKIPGLLAGRELSPNDFQARYFSAYQELAGGNPHPYAVWNNYKRVRRHGVRRLLSALVLCAEVDAALKRGAGALTVEHLILAVCGVRSS